MPDSKTPRTDKAKWESAQDCYGQTGFLCWASHAEELETELADALRERDTLRATVAELVAALSAYVNAEDWHAALEQDAIAALSNAMLGQKFRWAYVIIRDALARK